MSLMPAVPQPASTIQPRSRTLDRNIITPPVSSTRVVPAERTRLMARYALDTPPSSDVETATNLPPSPPISTKRASFGEVDRLIRHLRLRRRGRREPESDWLVFKLTASEFEEFERRLQADPRLWSWFEDKVRYDWDPERGRLVLRMPSSVHERFITCVEDEIGAAIHGLAERLQISEREVERKIAEELKKVHKGRRPTLHLRVPQLESSSSSQESEHSGDGGEKIVRRSPDATFYHPAQPHFPVLVIEVARSQQEKDLHRLADSYIIDSSHAIRAVLGLKIPYSPPDRVARARAADKSAWFSVWRPAIERGSDAHDGNEDVQEVGICVEDTHETFRGSDGAAARTRLDMRLSDFLPASSMELGNPRLEGLSVSVSLHHALTILDEAESEPAPETAEKAPRAPTTFRKRKRTPSEELSDGREQSFARQEARELEKDTAGDGEYVEAGGRVRRRTSARQAIAGADAEDVAVRSTTRPSTRGSADAG